MTVSNSGDVVQLQCNGTTTAFPYPYVFFSPGDLIVWLWNPVAGSYYAPDPVLNGSNTYDYTISGTQDPNLLEYLSGCTITLNNAPPAPYVLFVFRLLANTQNTALTNNSLFPAKAVEGALDRLTLLAQQLNTATNAALKIPLVDPPGLNTVLPAAAARAGMLQGYDSTGQPIMVPPAQGAVLANELANAVPGFLIDRSFTPPVIETWQVFTGVINNKGQALVLMYFPTQFPSGVLSFSPIVTYATAPGVSTGWWIISTDYQTKIVFGIIDAKPGTNFEIFLRCLGT